MKALWGLAFAVLTAQPLGAQDQIVTGADVKAAVEREMRRNNITGDPKVADGRRYYSCASDLNVAPKYQGAWETVNVTCPDPDREWTIMVRTGQITVDVADTDPDTPKGNIQVVVLLASVKKGQVLTPDILKLVEMPRSGRLGAFFRIEDVAGRRSTQALSALQPLRARHLEHDWSVQEGQPVQIVQTVGFLQVSSTGISLENAQIGDIVQVENTKSGKIIKALVESSKKVTPIANID